MSISLSNHLRLPKNRQNGLGRALLGQFWGGGRACSPAVAYPTIYPPLERTPPGTGMTQAISSQWLFDIEDLDLSPAITNAVKTLSQGTIDERGAIYTKGEVVDFILELLAFKPSFWAQNGTLLEPSFGGGDFLLPIAQLIFEDYQCENRSESDFSQLLHSITSFELHALTFESTRARLITLAESNGFSKKVSTDIADAWLHRGDFLLAPIKTTFDYVIGNPPYIRQESIPDVLLREYRLRYQTIYDRADIYVPFIERSLTLLKPNGCLGFICADRWMKNRYGAPLRKFVTSRFHLRYVVDMVEADAFHADVTAYPAVIVIDREAAKSTKLAKCDCVSPKNLNAIAKRLKGKSGDSCQLESNSNQPWLLDSGPEMAIVRRLEKLHPTLEEAGCKIGIGVATGADRVFIGSFESLDVEESRKLPLAMTKDIQTGRVEWSGYGVVNPFEENGELANLDDYPRFAKYLKDREDVIRNRNVAKKNVANWYRTIDRITTSLTYVPKLLVPDIKGKAHFVYETGNLYPHHNLYYITSTEWDLRALQSVLMAWSANFFVAAYSTKMRGSFLRFQAQNLRRIRVPHWVDVCAKDREALIAASESLDFISIRDVVLRLYGITSEEAATIKF
ncbi:MAG: Eco57I restriction-modification methylase domain-containing protein [Pirellula sp.]|nr:Eco57I restriction-modification methylase domain-containing protein [Pirellula sp.]